MIKQVRVGQMSNFAYIICDDNAKECAIVDPGWDPDKILSETKEYNVKAIILTHTHYDHIQSLKAVVEKTSAKVYVHQLEKEAVTSFDPITLEDGDTINIGEIKIRVIHTPGHTPGGICLYFDGNILTGDTLFVGCVGRVDLPGSSLAQLRESFRYIMSLPDDTIVWPGHDYGDRSHSTIGEEKKCNPNFKP